MTKKALGTWTLALMNVSIVASLQIITAVAVFGSALISYYTIAVLTFFIPTLLIIAELVTANPITGGAYVWVERAFGKNWGFFTVCIQWLCNLIWYPTIFSLIATSLAYLVSPPLAENKSYILISMLTFFWAITFLNCLGIKVSGILSALSAVLGVILPSLILILLSFLWVTGGHNAEVHLSFQSILPHITSVSQLAFLTQVIISLIGLEMAFVHAGDVKNPSKTIPKALLLSAVLILFIVVLAPLAIATVVPQSEISVISGLFDALHLFFERFHIAESWYLVILSCVFLGNLGNVTAWMISSTRGMHVACLECQMPSFLQKTNRFHAPLGILIVEAILFSLFSFAFLYFETLSNGYWFLLILASQVALIYYLFIFKAAVKLKQNEKFSSTAFQIPGGVMGTKAAAFIASSTTILAIVVGFFPPELGSVSERGDYSLLLALGICFILVFPVLLLQWRKRGTN